jgi:hypothetical protein
MLPPKPPPPRPPKPPPPPPAAIARTPSHGYAATREAAMAAFAKSWRRESLPSMPYGLFMPDVERGETTSIHRGPMLSRTERKRG